MILERHIPCCVKCLVLSSNFFSPNHKHMILKILKAIGEIILEGVILILTLAYMIGVILGGAIVAYVVIEKIIA